MTKQDYKSLQEALQVFNEHGVKEPTYYDIDLRDAAKKLESGQKLIHDIRPSPKHTKLMREMFKRRRPDL